jgi:hypothetical protein
VAAGDEAHVFELRGDAHEPEDVAAEVQANASADAIRLRLRL